MGSIERSIAWSRSADRSTIVPARVKRTCLWHGKADDDRLTIRSSLIEIYAELIIYFIYCVLRAESLFLFHPVFGLIHASADRIASVRTRAFRNVRFYVTRTKRTKLIICPDYLPFVKRRQSGSIRTGVNWYFRNISGNIPELCQQPRLQAHFRRASRQR